MVGRKDFPKTKKTDLNGLKPTPHLSEKPNISPRDTHSTRCVRSPLTDIEIHQIEPIPRGRSAEKTFFFTRLAMKIFPKKTDVSFGEIKQKGRAANNRKTFKTF